MPSGFVHAVRTLTIAPFPGREDAGAKHRALPWFAVVGCAVGGLHYLAGWAFVATGLPGTVALQAIFLAVLTYGITGALHLDGLGDFVDAFGTLHGEEKTRAIMKDPHLGTFGIAGVVVAILVRVELYRVLLINDALRWLIFTFGISRLVQAIVLALAPYAGGRQGKAGGYRATNPVRVVLVVEAAACITALVYREGATTAAIPLVAGGIAALIVCLKCMRRLGGITGDCVGASSELFELTFLTGAIACLN